MDLWLYDTFSRSKKKFEPLLAGIAKMYCCGITPYSNMHIGHTRTFFSYDLLFRTLQDFGYAPQWARNITDIDDKIIARANQEGISCEALVDRYVTEQEQMLQAFHLNRPDAEPKVTTHIPHIISFITQLIQKGVAYATPSGVYYRVSSFEAYGKLSGNNTAELKRGARIEVDETKEDALDFALWKTAKEHEPHWPSPWGPGRPGWHIECSAMIQAQFGEQLDIHMGGRDLIFPHHEAEIAQCEALTEKALANIWMHVGMVTLYGEKMSKSTGHLVSVADFLKKYPAEVLRLSFLSVSYAQPLDFTFELAEENLKKLKRMYRFAQLMEEYLGQTQDLHPQDQPLLFAQLPHLKQKMREELAQDLGSTGALAQFFAWMRETNVQLAKWEKQGLPLGSTDAHILQCYWPELKTWMSHTLGLWNEQNFLTRTNSQHIQDMLTKREKARQEKDWATSDILRQDLLAEGVQVQDTPRGTRWTVVCD